MRLSRQVETRKFKLDHSISGIYQQLGEYPPGIVRRYVERLSFLVASGRSYQYIGGGSCDSLWELECLGLGQYARKYAVVIDLSDALDYVMHCEFGCSVAEIRAIQDYDHISAGMLNFDFKDVDAALGTVFVDSPVFKEDVARMARDVAENAESLDSTINERISQLVFRFYSRILNMASLIKNYVVADLQRQFAKQLVYRSKSFSSAILTSDEVFEDELLLRWEGREEYHTRVSSYRRYEWARKGIIREIGRYTFNRE